MQRILSKDNALIKHIKKLKEKKYREKYGEYVVEGLKMINEAIREKMKISHIVICDGCDKLEIIESHLKNEMTRYECIYVPKNIFKVISEVETPQGVLAIIKKNEIKEIDIKEKIILALDDIQDPGNAGTILRTVDSCGLKQILVSKGTVDFYSSKVVRSTMGAIFRVNVIECENLRDKINILKGMGYKVMITALDAKKSIYDVNYDKSIIVIGNEANGVSNDVKEIASEKVIIPMKGKTESLNASVATGIILYEAMRQEKL